MTGLQVGLKPGDFIYVEPCWAEDDLGIKYIGTSTGIRPTKELATKGSFIFEARFTPPLNPKAKKVNFSFELEPSIKLNEAKFSGSTLADKDRPLEEGLVLEKVVQRPKAPDLAVFR